MSQLSWENNPIIVKGGAVLVIGSFIGILVQAWISAEEIQFSLGEQSQQLERLHEEMEHLHERQEDTTEELKAQTVQLSTLLDVGRDRFSQRENRFEELETMHSQTHHKILLLYGTLGVHSGIHQQLSGE